MTFSLAYIDPGLLSLVFQVVFVSILGALFTWLAAPWRWLRGMFRRRRGPDSDEGTLVETDEGRAE